MVVLFMAGDQVPLIPFNEVSGSGGIAVPAQTAATGVNVGFTGALTVTVNEVVTAHAPETGVKV